MNSQQRRRELGELLRSRRVLLSPEVVGLPRGERRRARGLRREELAALSGISPSWYTWLEQGREVRPSLRTLQRIAVALRLSPEESTYLTLLAGFRPSQVLPSLRAPDAAKALSRTLESFATVPAVLYNQRFDVIAANAIAYAIYGRDMDSESRWQRNMLWRFFRDPERRHMYPDDFADQGIRNLIDALRMNCASSDECDGIGELVDELRGSSREFDAIWRERRVANLATVPGRVRPLTSDEVIPVQYTRLSVHGVPHHAIAALIPVSLSAASSLERYVDRAC
jgi:transcriptional regulator with XRE-family HTH domain